MGKKSSFSSRFLDRVERVGNRLPDPATLFVVLGGFVLLLSFLISKSGATVVHPNGTTITAVNLLAIENLRSLFTNAVKNFTDFHPLGLVLTIMIGMGVAEGSGLVSAALRGFVTSVPRKFLTAAMVFAGVNASLAADAGYVVLVPLAAWVFASAGRHPLAGLSAAFSGVSGGFSANLLLTSLDPLLSGLSTQAAQILVPHYVVQTSANYYFMAASVFLLTIVGTVVNDRFVEPRLGVWKPEADIKLGSEESLSRNEKKGLKAAGICFLVFMGLVVLLTLPKGGLFQLAENPEKPFRTAVEAFNPLFQSLVILLTLLFFLCGLVYGVAARTVKSDRDVTQMIASTLNTMGAYLLLAFVAAQFVAWFRDSNLGVMLAIEGGQFLQAVGLRGVWALLLFIVVSATINIFIGSASAKWAILAPVFVPMMMMQGISPELTQVTYRVGDSITNVISPLLPYFPLIITYAQRYDRKAGLGTIISCTLPYSIAFAICWSIFLVTWYLIGFDLGPAGPLNFDLGQMAK